MTPPKTKITPLKRTQVMIPEETHKALWDLSKKGNRSFSREVRTGLEKYVAAERKKR